MASEKPRGDEGHGELDDLLQELLWDYVERLNRGEHVDEAELRLAHPELADEILRQLEVFDQIGTDEIGGVPEALGTFGDYTLRRQIGRGGMGVVYEAWENSMDRVVALKVLPAGIAADTKASTRFMREAQAAGRLSHRNVVSVFSMGVTLETPYYAMEYVEGKTLAQVLARIRAPDGDAGVDVETPFGRKGELSFYSLLASAFADVADGLQHAHSKGVIHRDIKPSNLILDGEKHLRILDFGLARLEGQDSLTISGDIVGTPLYMSPEQARRKKIAVDHRTDVYSLGATMYETLTGRPPFRGEDHADTLSQIIERDPLDPSRVNPRVPKDLETIALKCMRKDPDDRYGTAEALAQDLRRFVRGDPIEARPQSTWQRLATRFRRQRTKLAVAAVFLVLGGVAGWLGYQSAQPDAEQFEQTKIQLAQKNAQLQKARYESAVRELLNKISAAQYSLQALAGKSGGLFFGVYGGYLGRVTPQDLEALWEAQETHPLEDACLKLARVVDDVERPVGHYHLAKAYLLLGRERNAGIELEIALNCDPDFVPARVLRSELSETEDHPSALEGLREEYRASGDWRSAWVEAQWSAKNQEWRRATTAFRELIALGAAGHEPYIGASVEANIGSAMAYLELGDYTQAQLHSQAARTREPGFVQASLLLGKALYLEDAIYHRNDKAETAGDIFSELYERSNPTARDEIAFWVAGVYETLKAPKKGLQWIEKLSERVPCRERLRAYFLFRGGHRAGAIAPARKAVAIDERDPIAHRILASALIEDFYASSVEDRVRKTYEMLVVAWTAVQLDRKSTFSSDLLRLAKAQRDRAAWSYLGNVLRSRSEATRGLTRVLYDAALTLWPSEAASVPGHKGYFADAVQIDPGIGQNNLCATTGPGELVLFFNHYRRSDPRQDADVYYTTRESNDEPFRVPAKPFAAINTEEDDWLGAGSLSADGKEIYFTSTRPGGHGGRDLWVVRFNVPFDPEGGVDVPENLGPEVNTTRDDSAPHLSRDGLRLYFLRGKREHWVVSRELPSERFQNPVLVHVGLNGTWLWGPSLSADERTLFWGGYFPERPGGYGCCDLWMTTRERIVDELGRPIAFYGATNLGPPSSTLDSESAPHVTPDWPNPGSGLYFSRDGPAGWSIYRATWHPDCNGNRIDDRDEIAAGTVADADGDGVPDDCDR